MVLETQKKKNGHLNPCMTLTNIIYIKHTEKHEDTKIDQTIKKSNSIHVKNQKNMLVLLSMVTTNVNNSPQSER